MNIVIDATLSPRIARTLDAVLGPEHRVTHVRGLSDGQATDAQLHEFTSANNPALVIGLDLETTAQPHRLAALKEFNCHAAVLATDWLKIRPTEQAWRLLHVFPRLLTRVQSSSGLCLVSISAAKGLPIRKIA